MKALAVGCILGLACAASLGAQNPEWIMGKGNSFTRLEARLAGFDSRIAKRQESRLQVRPALLSLDAPGYSHCVDRDGLVFPVALEFVEELEDGRVLCGLRVVNVYSEDWEALAIEVTALDSGRSRVRATPRTYHPSVLHGGDTCTIRVLVQPAGQAPPRQLQVRVSARENQGTS